MTRIDFSGVFDYGDRALLVEVAGTAEVLAVADALRRDNFKDVLDIVPGARTVLVTLAHTESQARVRSQIESLRVDVDPHANDPDTTRTPDVTIDVVYDGADLADVARMVDMDVAEVVTAHTAAPWRVGFGGFAPGFAYLVGGDPALQVPRRSEPRTSVPAGSVGLAGEFSGVYPRESPGGWQLIGRTDAVLWDVDRSPPALLEPGRWVQFRAVGA